MRGGGDGLFFVSHTQHARAPSENTVVVCVEMGVLFVRSWGVELKDALLPVATAPY